MKKLPTQLNCNKTLAIAKPIGSIDAYIYWINQIPPLSAEEEVSLATKFRKEGDLNAARSLVLSHLRFVVHIAKNYLGYGLAKSDLIQEGTIGLMKAVKRFDPKMGVRLVSFAVHWIKAEIHEFILRNWRIVKIATTKAQRKLFFKLRRAPKKLNWFSNSEILHVARELKVRPQDVRSMEARLYHPDVMLDSDNEDDNNWDNPANYLVANEKDPAEEITAVELGEVKTSRLTAALEKLDQRSRNILERRWLQEGKTTLHELAKEYNVSAERIRQIEENSIKQLKLALTTT